MAFRNASAIATATGTDYTIYTSPAGYEAVVHAFYISNNSTGNVSATVTFVPASGSSLPSVKVLNAAEIIVNTSLVFDKPINLRPGDAIHFQSNTAGTSVFASILLNVADTSAP